MIPFILKLLDMSISENWLLGYTTTDLFLKTVNMSISAGWLVLAVLAARFLLKKGPKWMWVLLWSIVAIRLLCPFCIESPMSLIPSTQTVSPGIMMDRTPELTTGIEPLDTVINPVFSGSFAPEPAASANPLQILIPLCSLVWIAGIVVFLLYTAVSYLSLRKRVAAAVILRENIFQSEYVDSPFVLGILRPRIYLPYSMDGENMAYVIAHEQAHIRRKDHWWKPLGFLLLTIHWFNPLLWLAYILLCRDIELACDEKVIREFDNGQRADYSQALLSSSMNRKRIAACPLAFGEVGVKERIKNVLNYKKPSFWMIVLAAILLVMMAVCFLTDPQSHSLAEPERINKTVEQNGHTLTVLEATHCENMIRVVADVIFPADWDPALVHPTGVALRFGDSVIKCKFHSSTDELASEETGNRMRFDFRFELDQKDLSGNELTITMDGFADSTNTSAYALEAPMEISWIPQKFGDSRRFSNKADTCTVTVDISSIAVNVEVFQTELLFEGQEVLSMLKVYDKNGEIIPIRGSNGGGYSGSHIDFSVNLHDVLDINVIEKVKLGDMTLE